MARACSMEFGRVGGGENDHGDGDGDEIHAIKSGFPFPFSFTLLLCVVFINTFNCFWGGDARACARIFHARSRWHSLFLLSLFLSFFLFLSFALSPFSHDARVSASRSHTLRTVFPPFSCFLPDQRFTVVFLSYSFLSFAARRVARGSPIPPRGGHRSLDPMLTPTHPR